VEELLFRSGNEATRRYKADYCSGSRGKWGLVFYFNLCQNSSILSILFLLPNGNSIDEGKEVWFCNAGLGDTGLLYCLSKEYIREEGGGEEFLQDSSSDDSYSSKGLRLASIIVWETSYSFFLIYYISISPLLLYLSQPHNI